MNEDFDDGYVLEQPRGQYRYVDMAGYDEGFYILPGSIVYVTSSGVLWIRSNTGIWFTRLSFYTDPERIKKITHLPQIDDLKAELSKWLI